MLALVGCLTALAGLAHYGSWAPVPRFAAATLALAGLAWVVSFATEQFAEHFGPAITGMLQASLSNLPELFVVIFALQKGELVVAQTAIIGSILANALLVLGLVIVVGARRAPDGIMRFSTQLPRDTATLLQVTVFIIVLLGLSVSAQSASSHHIESISIVGSICLLVVYATWASGYLRSDTRPSHRAAQADAREDPPGGALQAAASPQLAPAPRVSAGAALALLAIAAVAAAFVSDWFISSLSPAIEVLNLSQAFAGLVIVAIAGNAVEHTTGLVLAWKGQSDLAISVVKNSVAQIAAFLYPLLVLVSFALATTLTFSLAPIYIGALVLTTLALSQITGDGEAAAFEGWALISLYVIVATFTLYE